MTPSSMVRFAVLYATLCWVQTSAAWGPHWHITRAGIDALGSDHVITKQLGPELSTLTNFCWIPDFKRLPFRNGADDFYSDDYLLFPGVTKHLDHICPEVQQTYEPYFRRALQALRSESPKNAARWVGSLLHFVQDSGSPPHAARMRGDLHIKMETWVVASNITAAGYVPKLLGTSDDEAVHGLVARMNELIAFAEPRGKKLRTPVLLANRRAVASVALECANECARVSADVLHTLATLAAKEPGLGFELSGRVQTVSPAAAASFQPKLVFIDTNISTVADASGAFRLRNVPQGVHRIAIVTSGSEVLETNLTVTASKTNLVFTPKPSGNLVRNGAFALHWVSTNSPDCWTKLPQSWEGEVLALVPGTRYEVRGDFLTNSAATIVVHWAAEQRFVIPKPMKIPRYQTRRLTRDEPQFIMGATTNAALVLLSVRSPSHPTNHLRRVSVTPMAD